MFDTLQLSNFRLKFRFGKLSSTKIHAIDQNIEALEGRSNSLQSVAEALEFLTREARTNRQVCELLAQRGVVATVAKQLALKPRLTASLKTELTSLLGLHPASTKTAENLGKEQKKYCHEAASSLERLKGRLLMSAAQLLGAIGRRSEEGMLAIINTRALESIIEGLQAHDIVTDIVTGILVQKFEDSSERARVSAKVKDRIEAIIQVEQFTAIRMLYVIISGNQSLAVAATSKRAHTHISTIVADQEVFGHSRALAYSMDVHEIPMRALAALASPSIVQEKAIHDAGVIQIVLQFLDLSDPPKLCAGFRMLSSLCFLSHKQDGIATSTLEDYFVHQSKHWAESHLQPILSSQFKSKAWIKKHKFNRFLIQAAIQAGAVHEAIRCLSQASVAQWSSGAPLAAVNFLVICGALGLPDSHLTNSVIESKIIQRLVQIVQETTCQQVVIIVLPLIAHFVKLNKRFAAQALEADVLPALNQFNGVHHWTKTVAIQTIRKTIDKMNSAHLSLVSVQSQIPSPTASVLNNDNQVLITARPARELSNSIANIAHGKGHSKQLGPNNPELFIQTVRKKINHEVHLICKI